MAGLYFYMNTGEVSLTATVAKTVIEINAPTNHRVHIHEVDVMFKGTTVGNEPVTVQLTRFAATGTGTAGTAQKYNAGDNETIQTTFKYNDTVEPATQTVLQTWSIHPQSGVIYPLPITRPIPIIGGGFLGIRITADDAVVATTTVVAEE